MARPRKSDGGESAAPAAPNGAVDTKAAALREALRVLGRKAKNDELAGYIRTKYGEAMVPANMSVAKSSLKKRRGGRRKGKTAEAGPAAEAAPAPKTIQVEHLHQIKELSGKYGKDHVKKLVDLIG